jgi:hypothetical protein
MIDNDGRLKRELVSRKRMKGGNEIEYLKGGIEEQDKRTNGRAGRPKLVESKSKSKEQVAEAMDEEMREDPRSKPSYHRPHNIVARDAQKGFNDL